MIGTNCFGRLSPVIARVIDCNRVPSPPANITAHRSLMLLASLSWSSSNNHESGHETIPYNRATKRHKKHKQENGSSQHRLAASRKLPFLFVTLVPFCGFTRRFVGEVSRRGRSNPFDDSRRRPSQCRHGKIRGRGRGLASSDQVETFPPRQTRAAAGPCL